MLCLIKGFFKIVAQMFSAYTFLFFILSLLNIFYSFTTTHSNINATKTSMLVLLSLIEEAL